jgi:density-regulated protein
MEFVPHTAMPAMDSSNTPVQVTYCSTCGLPPDFCKYGPLWDKHAPTVDEVSEAAPAEVAEPRKKSSSSSSTVTVKIAPRVGRRYLTTIGGLEAYDVDLAKAVKMFSKKYACGVCKTDTNEIEIQGDCEENIVEVITSNWKQIRAKYITIKRKEKS